MIIVAYFLVGQFGFISGLGISSFCWLLSMVILDDRLEKRESEAHAKWLELNR